MKQTVGILLPVLWSNLSLGQEDVGFRLDLQSGFENDTVSLWLDEQLVYEKLTFTTDNDHQCAARHYFTPEGRHLFGSFDGTSIKIKGDVMKIRIQINSEIHAVKVRLSDGRYLGVDASGQFQQQEDIFFYASR